MVMMKKVEIRYIGFALAVLLALFFFGYDIYQEKVPTLKPLSDSKRSDEQATASTTTSENFIQLSNYYVKKGQNIYYAANVRDPGTFEVVSGALAKDGVSAYWMGQPLQLDPKDLKYSSDQYGRVVYAYDASSLYMFMGDKAVLVPDSDPMTFQIIKQTSYAKDAHHVYDLSYGYNNDSKVEVMKGADPLTFTSLGVCEAVETDSAKYAKDSRNVYVEGTVLSGADAATFSVLKSYSSESGMPMSYSFAQDRDNIYYNCGRILKEADHATFRYVGDGKAEDKNNEYSLGEFGVSIKKRSN